MSALFPKSSLSFLYGLPQRITWQRLQCCRGARSITMEAALLVPLLSSPPCPDSSSLTWICRIPGPACPARSLGALSPSPSGMMTKTKCQPRVCLGPSRVGVQWPQGLVSVSTELIVFISKWHQFGTSRWSPLHYCIYFSADAFIRCDIWLWKRRQPVPGATGGVKGLTWQPSANHKIRANDLLITSTAS